MKLTSFLAVASLCLSLAALGQAPSAEPGKDAPRRLVPKKEAAAQNAKKSPAKKAAPAKAASPSTVQVSKNVTVYTNTPPPALKDKQGKDIPVAPDAYDVSSALPRKK